MSQGMGLRAGVIDGAISISAVQWLCNADKSSHEPRLRLKKEKSSWSSYVVLFQLILTMVIKIVSLMMMIAKMMKRMEWFGYQVGTGQGRCRERTRTGNEGNGS
ncbi:unnamed protein product [Brassica oleracea]